MAVFIAWDADHIGHSNADNSENSKNMILWERKALKRANTVFY